MSLPRIARNLPPDIVRRSSPLNSARPATFALWGNRPSRASALTDLPDPDSPTMARVSPGFNEKLRPRTAAASPRRVGKVTVRSSTERRGSTMSGAGDGLRVERVAQPVADEVEAEDDGGDHGARDEHRAGHRGELTLVLGDQGAEGGLGRLDAEGEERQGALEDDGGTRDEGELDDDGPDRVREHVAEDDAVPPRACRTGGLDELLLTEGEELRPDDSGGAGPHEQ